MKTPDERIAELEATVGMLLRFLNPTADAITMTHRRLLALEGVLEGKRVVTEDEVNAKIQAIDDASKLEAEYSPEFEEWRRLREFLRRQLEEEDAE
jgi:hypothetical protein